MQAIIGIIFHFLGGSASDGFYILFQKVIAQELNLGVDVGIISYN